MNPTFDQDGYPTEETCQIIEKWVLKEPKDWYDLMEFVHEAWNYKNYFRVRGRFYRLATGGWSGNEDIISSLKTNYMFWGLCWHMSKRGGCHLFELPELK